MSATFHCGIPLISYLLCSIFNGLIILVPDVNSFIHSECTIMLNKANYAFVYCDLQVKSCNSFDYDSYVAND